MPMTSPVALNASTTALWRGNTAMIASIEAPDPSPMMTHIFLHNANYLPTKLGFTMH